MKKFNISGMLWYAITYKRKLKEIIMTKYQNIAETIGNTPLVKINKLTKNSNLYAKVEFFNPAGSVKDPDSAMKFAASDIIKTSSELDDILKAMKI